MTAPTLPGDLIWHSDGTIHRSIGGTMIQEAFTVRVEGEFSGTDVYTTKKEAIEAAEFTARAEQAAMSADSDVAARRVYVMQTILEVVAETAPVRHIFNLINKPL